MSYISRLLFAAAMLLLLPATAHPQSQQFKNGTVRVIEAWAPPSIGAQRASVAYFTVINDGPGEDKLLAVSAKGAGWAALHGHIVEGDIVRMRPLDGLAIPPGATLTLKPGGVHVMLFDMSAPLVSGQRLPLQLQFARAGKINLEAEIRDAAPGPASSRR